MADTTTGSVVVATIRARSGRRGDGRRGIGRLDQPLTSWVELLEAGLGEWSLVTGSKLVALPDGRGSVQGEKKGLRTWQIMLPKFGGSEGKIRLL